MPATGTDDTLDLRRVFGNRLSGIRVFGVPTLIPLHTFPETELPNVVFEDPDAELDVILDFEEVDALFIGLLAPSGQVNLHNADGVTSGNREGVGPAFDDHDARDEERVDIVLSTASDDRRGDPAALAFVNLIFTEESIDGQGCGVLPDYSRGFDGRFLNGLFCILIRENE